MSLTIQVIKSVYTELSSDLPIHVRDYVNEELDRLGWKPYDKIVYEADFGLYDYPLLDNVDLCLNQYQWTPITTEEMVVALEEPVKQLRKLEGFRVTRLERTYSKIAALLETCRKHPDARIKAF